VSRGELPARWRDALQQWRDDDFAHAPGFEQMLAGPLVRPPLRRLRLAVSLAAGSALAAVAVSITVLRVDALPDTAQVSWTHWRSPTAALIGGTPAFGSWASPTATLVAPLPGL
jgi:hypothetical protein